MFYCSMGESEFWKNCRYRCLDDSNGLQQCREVAYATYQDRMGGKRLPPMEVDYACEIKDFPSWVADFQGLCRAWKERPLTRKI